MIDTLSYTQRAEEYFAAKNAFTTGPVHLPKSPNAKPKSVEVKVG